MKEVTPYKTVAGALRALDNGGRFYNLFTKAGDGTVTNSELLRAAGVVLGRDQAFLFFSLALSGLEPQQREEVIAHLDPEVQKQYEEHRPIWVDAEQCAAVVEPSRSVVTAGFPRFVEDRTEFSFFVMIPVTAGGTTTFTMIPMFDRFDVYELHDPPDLTGKGTLIATAKGKRKLGPSRLVVGGLVRELKFKSDTRQRHRIFVEALYYLGGQQAT